MNDQFKILVKQISAGVLSVEEAAAYQQRFDEALQKAVVNNGDNFVETGFLKTNTILLKETAITGRRSSEQQVIGSERISFADMFKKLVILLIAAALITLGFSMIILPAPPYFEMFTIFYFNDQDGVTIMDVISLIIILCGVYLFVITITKHRKI